MRQSYRSIQGLRILLVTCMLLLGTSTAHAQGILEAEYFWDTDPGAGNGTAMSVSDGNFDEALETVFSNGITLPATGNHSFNVRMKDSPNTWGPVFTAVISIENNISPHFPSITAAEYFWNTDPGPGNGTPFIAFDGNYDEALEAAFANGIPLLGTGLHTFSVRMRDSLTIWGPVFTTVISIENTITPQAPDMSTAEYFWDTDPGQGNASPMVAFDGNFDEALEQATGTPPLTLTSGLHTFNARLRSTNGIWGPVFTTVLSVEDTISPTDRTILAGEVYFDVDPGPGNGTPILVSDGNFDEALEGLQGGLMTLSLSLGPHTCNLRQRDASNQWGPVFTTVVWVDTSLVPITTQITGPVSLCESQGLNGHLYTTLYNPGDTYNWTVTGGTITSGQGTDSVTVNWSANGPYSIAVQGCNTNGCGNTFTESITIVPAFNPSISHTGSSTLCLGDSLELVSNNAGGVDIQWIRNGSPITGATSSTYQATSNGNYQVIFSDGPNCPDTSSVVAVTVLSALVADAGSDQTLCFGVDSLQIGGAPSASGSLGPYSYQWTGTGISNNQLANPSVAPLVSGSYTLQVQDAAGCISSDTVLVTLNPQIMAQAGSDTSVCNGASATLGGSPSASGGNGNFSYSWFPTTGLSSSTSANPVASPTSGNNYELTVMDGEGCTEKDTVFLHIFPALFAEAGSDTSLCENSTLTLGGNPTATGGDGPYTYSWIPTTGLNNPSAANPVVTAATSTNYSVQVTDFNNCVATANIQITSLPLPSAGFTFAANQGMVTFTDASQDADSVHWDFGDNNTSGQSNPNHTYTASGNYTVCQVAFNGCGTDTSCQTVNVVIIGTELPLSEAPLIYPNPSSGRFTIDTKGMELENIEVYDAVGRIVFQRTGSWSINTRINVDLPNLPSAVYYLELKSKGQSFRKSLVISSSIR